MSHDQAAFWVNGLGGLAIVLLGLFVLTVRPRAPSTVAFGLLSVGFGGTYVVIHGSNLLHAQTVAPWIRIPFPLLWAGSAVAVALLFPQPLARKERLSALLAGLAALVVAGTSAAGDVVDPGPAGNPLPALLGMSLGHAAFLGTILLLALRFRARPDATFRRQAALTAGGLGVFVGFGAGFGRSLAGSDSVVQATGVLLVEAWAILLATMAAALLWIAVARGEESRAARNVGLLLLSMIVVGMLTPFPGGHGVMRLLMALILAYAILRHQLLGIDLRVRWAISKGTIGAVFVAVFFLAGEGAQILFGTEDQWIGLLAAGALVFALAPLQRAADRLAERAVPAAEGRPETGGREEGTYLLALRKFHAAGPIGPEDELALARLASALRIGHVRAVELRQSVEVAERDPPGPPAR